MARKNKALWTWTKLVHATGGVACLARTWAAAVTRRTVGFSSAEGTV